MKNIMNQILISLLLFSFLSCSSSKKKKESAATKMSDQAAQEKKEAEDTAEKNESSLPTTSSHEYIKGVKTKVRAQSGDIATCYTKALRKSSNLIGILYFKWDILKDGSSESFKMDQSKSSITNEDLELCIMRVLARIEFEPLENKSVLHINYPFKFTGKKKAN